MCLAVPAKILTITAEWATVELNGNILQVNIALTPLVQPGDYVVIHAGYALQQLDTAAARETLAMMEEIYGTNPD